MNCSSPIEFPRVCGRCGDAFTMGIRTQCEECLRWVCVGCQSLHRLPAHINVCRACDGMDAIAPPNPRSWRSSIQFLGLILLCATVAQLIVAALFVLFGGAQ